MDIADRLAPSLDMPPPPREALERTGRQGRVALTPEFARWFAGSLVRNPDGSPLVVYRGEHGDLSRPGARVMETRLGSLSFGSLEAATLYAESPNDREKDTHAAQPRIVAAYLLLRNPLVNDREDPFLDMGQLAKAVGPTLAREFAQKHSGTLENTNNWEERFHGKFSGVKELLAKSPESLGDLYGDAFVFLDDPAVVHALREAGYDGAICGGTGETSLETEYRVFDRAQVRSAVGDLGPFGA